MTTKSQRENDVIRFKVSDFIKNNNKDMIPNYEELESTTFKGHRKAYNHIVEKYGSAFFETAVEVFINGEKSSTWDINIK